MAIRVYNVNEERIEAYLEQDELEQIIIEHIISKTGFNVDRETIRKIYFDKKDCGVSGFRVSAEIKLTNNLLEPESE